ncbi:MAG: PAS domain S-box protein, partial [Candidatus Thermoplasmatota archaeon]|nr:PAS domain S-box protein [Candidatus Thermoplasmatota archaeon]
MTTDEEDIYQFDELDAIATNLDEYRALCQLLYQGSYNLMLIANKLGKILTINKAGINFSGFVKEEVYGTHLLKVPGVFNKKEFNRCLKVYTDALRGIPTYDFETYPVNKQGKKHTMIFNVFPLKYKKKVKYIVLLAKDITEQKQNERLFKETNQIKTYLNNIIDSTNEIIFAIDLQNRITTWNNAMISLSGIPFTKASGKKITSLDIFTNPKELIQYKNQVLDGYTKSYDGLLVTSKKGKEKLLSVSGSILRDQEDKPNGIIFIGNDITGEKVLHGRLLPGTCYLNTSESSTSLYYSLTDLILEGYHGLLITRFYDESFESQWKKHQIDIVTLDEESYQDKKSIKTSVELVNVIQDFIKHHKKPVILLDRIDYLIINESFDSVLKNLYKITSLTRRTKVILMLHLDIKLLSEKEQIFLMKEFDLLPTRNLQDIRLNDSMYEILDYVNQQKKKNMMVSYKKLGRELRISKATVQK